MHAVVAGEVCSDCGSHDARVSLDGISLCDRCADRRIAALTGWPELPVPPPDVEMRGPDGRTHLIRFRLRRSPGGIVAEVAEIGPAVAEGEGYAASVIRAQDADALQLLAAVRRRIRADLSQVYLERHEDRDGWMLHGDTVEGRLEWAEGSESGLPYDVIVDDRRLSWEQFGRALEPFEGFRVRLIVSDAIEELDG